MRKFVVDFSMTLDETGTSATLNRVKDAAECDITASFIAYADKKGVELNTQIAIQEVAGDYAREFASILP